MGLALAAGGCAEEEAPGRSFAVKAGALAPCSGSNGTGALSEIGSMQVAVQTAGGTITFDERFSYGGSASLKVENVPEGPDETVTLLGYTDDPARPDWFGRQRHVIVQKGANNPVTVVMSRMGGFSCPAGDNEYTHRIFPSVTALGSGLFLIAGGLTTVSVGGVTKFGTSEASRKAFIYDSGTGSLKRISSAGPQSLMSTGRGAHAAILVRGSEKNRVVFLGGTNALAHNPQAENGFAWSYDTTDAHSSIEVFEWEVGTDPANGAFADFSAGSPQMYRKRVFPLVHVISTDGLVLACGGGEWGAAQKPEGYIECDVWDTLDLDFLPDTVSNNFMAQYRAGASVVSYQTGETTKLLFVGGATEGPIAEVYTSSSNQRDGVGGSFINKDIVGPPHSFFHSLTPIGDNRFVMVGGVNWNGVHFDPAGADTAWKLTVNDDGSSVSITADPIGGINTPRYFHAAAAVAGDQLLVLGGFTDNDLNPTGDILFFDQSPEVLGFRKLDDGPMVARGAMGFAALENDTVLLVGGVGSKDDFADEAGVIEIYSPSVLSL